MINLNLKDKSKDELQKLIEELNYKTTIAPSHLRPLIVRNLNMVIKEFKSRNPD